MVCRVDCHAFNSLKRRNPRNGGEQIKIKRVATRRMSTQENVERLSLFRELETRASSDPVSIRD